jgi:hypothetical protein
MPPAARDLFGGIEVIEIPLWSRMRDPEFDKAFNILKLGSRILHYY